MDLVRLVITISHPEHVTSSTSSLPSSSSSLTSSSSPWSPGTCSHPTLLPRRCTRQSLSSSILARTMWADNADKDDDINNIDDDDDNIDWGCTDQSILGRTMWADDDDKDGDVDGQYWAAGLFYSENNNESTESSGEIFSHKSQTQVTDSEGNIIIDVGNKDTWKFKKMQSKYFIKKSPPVVSYLFFFPPSLFVVRAIGWRSRKTLKKIHLNSCASSPLSFLFYLFQNSVLSSLSPYTPTFFQLKKHPGVSLFSFLVLRHPSP